MADTSREVWCIQCESMSRDGHCECNPPAPLAPSSAPAPEHLPEQEQDEGKTAKSATPSPSQLESSSAQDATCAYCGHYESQHLAAPRMSADCARENKAVAFHRFEARP